jgi:hypothetical protein
MILKIKIRYPVTVKLMLIIVLSKLFRLLANVCKGKHLI